MLIIRQAQIEAFSRRVTERFRDRAIERVGRTWPSFLPRPAHEALAAQVEKAIQAARAIGAESERDVMLFVLASVALGPEFVQNPDYPWAKEIAGDSSLAGFQKIALLTEAVERHLSECESLPRQG